MHCFLSWCLANLSRFSGPLFGDLDCNYHKRSVRMCGLSDQHGMGWCSHSAALCWMTYKLATCALTVLELPPYIHQMWFKYMHIFYRLVPQNDWRPQRSQYCTVYLTVSVEMFVQMFQVWCKTFRLHQDQNFFALMGAYIFSMLPSHAFSWKSDTINALLLP